MNPAFQLDNSFSSFYKILVVSKNHNAPRSVIENIISADEKDVIFKVTNFNGHKDPSRLFNITIIISYYNDHPDKISFSFYEKGIEIQSGETKASHWSDREKKAFLGAIDHFRQGIYKKKQQKTCQLLKNG